MQRMLGDDGTSVCGGGRQHNQTMCVVLEYIPTLSVVCDHGPTRSASDRAPRMFRACRQRYRTGGPPHPSQQAWGLRLGLRSVVEVSVSRNSAAFWYSCGNYPYLHHRSLLDILFRTNTLRTLQVPRLDLRVDTCIPDKFWPCISFRKSRKTE